MNRYLLILFVFLFSASAQAEIGLQLSAHHHYWNSRFEKNDNAPALGIGLGYIQDRLYVTGAYTYNNHDRKRDNDSSLDAASFPLTEVDIGIGYNIVTNISAFIGYRYQNISYENDINSDESFYESGHGLGTGIKFNQLLTSKWVLYESISLSTLWMKNQHETLDIGNYQDFSFNAMLGVLYRLTPMHSVSLDIAYKGSSLTHSEESLENSRGYLKTGLNLLVVF